MRPDLLALAAAALVAVGVAGCPRPHPDATATAACPAARELLTQATAAQADGHALRVLALARRADRACSSDATRARVIAAQNELGDGVGTHVPDLDARVAERLAGHPDRAIDALGSRAATLDAAALVELGRDHDAVGNARLAQLQLERAVARAEAAAGPRALGSWRLPRAGRETTETLVAMPDGVHAVTRNANLMQMWDLSSGAEVWSVPEPWLTAPEASPDGKLLVVDGGGGEGLFVLRLSTGERVLQLAKAGPPAQFGPDGHLFAARDDHTGYDELELPSGRVVARVDTAGSLSVLAVSHDRVLTFEEDPHSGRYATLIRDRAGAIVSTIPTGRVSSAHLFPSGRYALGLHGRIQLHDATGKRTFTFMGTRPAYSADGMIAFVDRDGAVEVHEVVTGALVRTIDAGAGVLPAFAAEPGVLITMTTGGVSTWDLAAGKRTSRLPATASADAIAFDAAGTRLAMGGSTGHATVWDLASGHATSITPRTGQPITTLAFGARDSLVVGTGRALPPYAYPAQPGPPDTAITSWDLGANRARWSTDVEGLTWLAVRPGHDELAAQAMVAVNSVLVPGLIHVDGAGAVTSVPNSDVAYAWMPDGSGLLREVDRDLSIVPTDGGPARVLVAQKQRWRIENADVSADGATVAVDVGGGRLALWDVATGEPTSMIFDDGVDQLAWSPAKSATSMVATAVRDRARLWDRHGARLASLVAHAPITGLAFRPDGRVLAVARNDGGVELWAVASGTRLVTLLAAGGDRALVLADDGRVDGELGDGADVALAWQVGAAMLPARGVWDRARTPGLLAMQLATVPVQDVPRDHLPGAEAAPAPAACVTPTAAMQTVTSRALDDHHVDVCIDGEQWTAGQPPACFQLDLATGVYRPRAATPREVLAMPEPETDVPTITVEPDRVEVCRGAHCDAIPTPELPVRPAVGDYDPRHVWTVTATDAAATTLAIYSKPHVGALYDVATKKLLGHFGAPGYDGELALSFVGATLLVTYLPCAGACAHSDLVSRTGKVLAGVPVNTSMVHPAQVDGDVWAFDDSDQPLVVYQNVATGRVVRSIQLPRACSKGEDCDDIDVHHVAGGIAVVSLSGHAGEVRVLDANGALAATHDVPVCRRGP